MHDKYSCDKQGKLKVCLKCSWCTYTHAPMMVKGMHRVNVANDVQAGVTYIKIMDTAGTDNRK